MRLNVQMYKLMKHYQKYYLLKLIYGYVAYSDCGLLEFRLGNVQKNAFASSEATCS